MEIQDVTNKLKDNLIFKKLPNEAKDYFLEIIVLAYEVGGRDELRKQIDRLNNK